jgi:hypothetical protein
MIVPSSNSLALNMSNELVATTIATKAHCFCLSTFVNISYIPLSLEDEELKLFDTQVLKLFHVELKRRFEDEAMITK